MTDRKSDRTYGPRIARLATFARWALLSSGVQTGDATETDTRRRLSTELIGLGWTAGGL